MEAPRGPSTRSIRSRGRRPDVASVLGGRQPRVTPEYLREMALVEESGAHADLRDRRVRRRQLARRAFDPEPTHVFADGAAVTFAKSAREVRWSDANRARQAQECQRIAGLVVQQL